MGQKTLRRIGRSVLRTVDGRKSLRSRSARIVLSLVVLMAVVIPPVPTSASSTIVGPKKYYLVLGASGAFGFQPNLDWNHGYSDQWFDELQTHGVKRMVNYACMAETTNTMITGYCPWKPFKRTFYTGSQLSAALRFLKAHPGEVSPVSLDLGMVDGDMAIWPPNSCSISQLLWDGRMSAMDKRLTTVILPQLLAAMTDEHGKRTGDLIMLNTRDPLQNDCPADFDAHVVDLNRHLAADAAQWGIPIADIYTPINSGPLPNQKLCVYTWICAKGNGHSTGGQPGEPGNGYGLIAQILEQTLGY